jgi:copper homeostasis protein
VLAKITASAHAWTMPPILLEVCVDNVGGLAAAVAGGADRIELCGALELGGLTPAPELMQLGLACPLPVVARIRPRAGDFLYEAVEAQLMLNDIDAVAAAGLPAVSLGASRQDGQLDHVLLERLLRRARDHGLSATLHRAFDVSPDLAQATRLAIDLGFERILTSGGAPAAVQGIQGLLHCFDAAAGRITVMPGAGIHAANVGRLREHLPLAAVHASCSVPAPGAGNNGRRGPARPAPPRRQTSAALVAALQQALCRPLR